jgi:hypothetical protein
MRVCRIQAAEDRQTVTDVAAAYCQYRPEGPNCPGIAGGCVLLRDQYDFARGSSKFISPARS